MNKCLDNAITVRCEAEAAAATGLSLPGFALRTNSHLCLGVRVHVFGLSAMAGPFGSGGVRHHVCVAPLRFRSRLTNKPYRPCRFPQSQGKLSCDSDLGLSVYRSQDEHRA